MPADALPPLQRLSALGQSVWVDFLSRESIRGGHLQELIDEHAVVGATSNPTIFQKAMSAGDAYDEQLHELAAQGADVDGDLLGAGRAGHQGRLRPLPPGVGRRRRTRRIRLAGGRPAARLRHAATFREAIRLHESVDRPNLMVKIPATKPGLAAIEDVVAKGRSINVTLIFSLRTLRGGRRVLHPWDRAARRRGRRPGRGGIGCELLRLQDRHRGRQAPG